MTPSFQLLAASLIDRRLVVLSPHFWHASLVLSAISGTVSADIPALLDMYAVGTIHIDLMQPPRYNTSGNNGRRIQCRRHI
jgi:hypothetical protein